MPATTVLTKSNYAKLLADLRKLIQEGKERARQAVNKELVQTYWEVGKRISEEKLTENAGYGDSIMEDLSEDLGIDLSTLRRSVSFFEQYQISAPWGTNLSWSHYKELLAIKDLKERRFYEETASKEGWSRNRLLGAIERDLWHEVSHKRGEKSPPVPLLTRPKEATYVYKALVEDVIDGDTLLVRLDLGFQVWKEQRIRLAEIDAPPIETPKGREAFEFVRDELAKAPFIMVKTNKIDIHGRYVAHVFYSFKEENKNKVFERGKYLNQELLNRGFAKLI